MSPLMPLGKAETARENHDCEGKARIASTSSLRAKQGGRSPSQTTVHSLAQGHCSDSPGGWYRLRYGSTESADDTRGLWRRTSDNHS